MIAIDHIDSRDSQGRSKWRCFSPFSLSDIYLKNFEVIQFLNQATLLGGTFIERACSRLFVGSGGMAWTLSRQDLRGSGGTSESSSATSIPLGVGFPLPQDASYGFVSDCTHTSYTQITDFLYPIKPSRHGHVRDGFIFILTEGWMRMFKNIKNRVFL